MTDTFAWPFFTDAHRALAADLRAWTLRELADSHAHENADVDDACRALVRQLGTAGWLRYTVPAVAAKFSLEVKLAPPESLS